MKARDVMTHPARTVREDRTFAVAARCMLVHSIGCVPPSLRLRDVVAQTGRQKEEAAAQSRHVGEFMSRAVACVDVAGKLKAVITKIQKTGFYVLPVVAAGLPVGIIARRDLVQLMVTGFRIQVIPAKGE